MVSAYSLRALSALATPVKALISPFPRANAAMWNAQYKLGLWDYLDSDTHAGRAFAFIEEFAPNPRILDLGCGTSANLALPPGRYRRYHGVDISSTAVTRGRALRRPHTSFEVADILAYESGGTYDAILLREVLYYLDIEKVAGFLRRLAGLLAPDGKIFVEIWDGYARTGLADVVRGCGLAIAAERNRPPADGPGGIRFVLAPA